MKLSTHNLLLGVLVLLLHLVRAHEAYDFSTKHGLTIKDLTPPLTPDYDIHTLNRSSFPPGFTFGLASSAYQVEGAWNVDGRGQSSWDNFTHSYPERIADHSNGDNATNYYHLYKEDVRLLQYMNADAYWFSISWARVLPNGRVNGGQGINHKGIEYYNNLIDEIIAKSLKPCVTIFVYDLPQAIVDEYSGLLTGTKFRKDFHDYADFLFRTFGNRVKQWSTMTEPNSLAQLGYAFGTFPPNRCSTWLNSSCFGGDSAIEPYQVAHIGHDIRFLSSITFGYYPQTMRDYVDKRLPEFTIEQSLLLRGSIDFFGFNYYTAFYVFNVDLPPSCEQPQSYSYDIRVGINYTNSNGIPIGEKLGISWQYSYAKGIRDYLHHIKHQYNDPIIYITENGASEVKNPNIPLEAALGDHFRIKFHFQHLTILKKAIDDGVQVKGYFGWSLLDHFEWLEGYTIGFGFVYIDYNTYKRYPKVSVKWFKRFLTK